jgi:hypothetical protein
MSCLGKYGAVFGALLGMGGVTVAPNPTWSVIERTISNQQDLAERSLAVAEIGFRRYPGPHKALWCGAAWFKYDLPREADYAPWDAFEYIDRENEGLIAEQGASAGNASDEAFKNHMLPIFNKKALVHRGDRLQLANRLFVNEALFIMRANDERGQIVGEYLLCPLIDRALGGLPHGAVQEDEFPEWVGLDLKGLLKYVSAQVIGPPGITWENPRKTYQRAWQITRSRARPYLTPPLRDDIIALTKGNRETIKGPVRQDAIETSGDVRWLRTKQTVRAYIELRKTGVIESTEEFLELVASLGPEAGFFFWREAYGLLLWGRAVELKPLLQANLERRLPSEGLKLEVLLKPREEMRAPPLPEKEADLEIRWRREMDPYIQQQFLKELLASDEVAMAAGSVTNVLSARVICDTEDVLIEAYHALIKAGKEPPAPPLTILPKAIEFINEDDTWPDLMEPAVDIEHKDNNDNADKKKPSTNLKYVRLQVTRIINGYALPDSAKKKDAGPAKKSRGLAAMQEQKVEILPGIACPLAGRSIWLTIQADAGKSDRGSKLKQLIEVELTMKNSLEARMLAKILDLTTAEELQEKVVIGAKRRRATNVDGL